MPWTRVDFADVAGDVTAIEVVDEGIKPLFLNGWFSDFKKLKRADLSRFDTSGCLDMGSLFKGCAQLEQVKLSGLNTASVTNMTCMFAGCESLVSLDLSSFDTSSVWGMARLFEGCCSLKDVDLSGFDMYKVELTTCMFAGCAELEKLDLPGVCALIDAGRSFLWCSLKDTSGMFDGCDKLRPVNASSDDRPIVLPGVSDLERKLV